MAKQNLERDLSQLESLAANIPADFLKDRIERRTTFCHLEGRSALSNTLLPGRPRCSMRDLFVLSGQTVTDKDGVTVLKLNDLYCPPGSPPSASPFTTLGPPHFVATPLHSDPVVLTTSIASEPDPGFPLLIGPDGQFIEGEARRFSLEVRSWKLGGGEAPRVRFSWLCVIEAARLIPISG